MKRVNIHINIYKNILYKDKTPLYLLIEVNNHWYLKWDPITAFSSFISSKTPQTNQRNITSRWYKVLTYAGLEAIKHLKKHINGAKIEDPKEALKTINCELCLISKAKHLISCCIGNEKLVIKPFERVAFDLILIEKTYNSDKWISYLYCVLIKINLLNIYKSKREYNDVLERFIKIIKIKFGYIVKFIRTDNEQSFGGKY